LGRAGTSFSQIPKDRDSLLHDWKMVKKIAIPTAAFETMQLIAWNFAFPTRAEQMFWRYICLSNGMVLGIGWAFEAGAIVVSKYTVAGLHTVSNYKLRWPYCIFFLFQASYIFARE